MTCPTFSDRDQALRQMMGPPTAQRLRELLAYDPATGIFTWRVSRGGAKGRAAGHLDRDGYLRVMIDGAQYYAHRLAWLYMTGEWPANQMDHKNGETGDNRFVNLREATRSQNQKNVRTHRDNASGFKGVVLDKPNKRWRAKIDHAGRTHFLGYFATAAEAHAAYCKAAKDIDPEFARFA